jgi:hypothetical protein
MSAYLDHSHVQHRMQLCFIHICPLSLHPYWLSHISHVLFCILPECVTACICMYWNYACNMHVLKACTCMCVSQALHVSACACLDQKLSTYLHVVGPYRDMRVLLHSLACILSWAFVCICGSRAEHLLACFESWACIFIQFPVSRAERVSSCAEGLFSACALFVRRFRELRVCLHVLSVCRLESWALVCMFRELRVYLHSVFCVECWVCACMHLKSWACVCMYLRVLGAEHVSLFVCLHQEWSVCVCVHVSARIKSLSCIRVHLSRTCFSMCLHTLRAYSLAACVWTYRELEVCLHVLRVSRVWHLSASFCIYQELTECPYNQELSVCTHMWASIKSWAWMCMSQRFWRFCHESACVDPYWELGVYLRVFSWFESLVCKSRFQHAACTSTSWPKPKAEHVSAFVGVHSEQCCCCLLYWGLCVCLHVCALRTYQHAFGLVMSHICLCMQESRAVDVSWGSQIMRGQLKHTPF